MLKKMLVCMTVFLLLTATACSNSRPESAPVSVLPADTTTTTAATTTTTTTTAAPIVVTAKPTTTATTTTAAPTTKAPENLIRLGTVDGRRYENPFLKIGCTIPFDWSFVDRADLLKENGLTASMTDRQIHDKLKKAEFFYDLIAISDDGCYLAATAQILDPEVVENVTLDELFTYFVAPNMGQQLKALGCTNQQAWNSYATIGGKMYPAAIAFGALEGITIYDITVGIPLGNYLYALTVTAYDQETAFSILSRFYLL